VIAMKRAHAVLLAMSVVGVARAASADTAASAAPSASARPAQGMTTAELERVLAQLDGTSVDARRAAAKAASELDADATEAIAQALVELRKVHGAGIQQVLRALRDQNGGKGDVVEQLLTQPKGDAASVRAALVTVCLARSLVHVGTTPSLRVLVAMAGDGGGSLRAELTRLLVQLGERSVAALVEARKDPSGETRTWAANVLDTLGKRLPGDAVQTKDNQVLSDVLHAYGTVKDLDAVPVILSFVNSERAQVRAAAREALGAYGQDAIWKLREAYAALTGKPANEAWTAPELAKQLFEAYDKSRLQEVYAMLDDGLAKQKAGQLDDAVAAFDKILARQPMLDRRGEMVGAYVQYAQSIEDKDRPTATAYLRKALRLDESGPRAQQIQSELMYLEGEDLLARGISDAELFRRAVALDPGNTRASAELARLEATSEAKQSHAMRWIAAAAVFLLAVAGIILFGGRRTRAAH
jgi:hypothetical protein